MEYLLFTDETNQQPSRDAKFFIYGGIFFSSDKLMDLHELVEEARLNNNYLPEDELNRPFESG